MIIVFLSAWHRPRWRLESSWRLSSRFSFHKTMLVTFKLLLTSTNLLLIGTANLLLPNSTVLSSTIANLLILLTLLTHWPSLTLLIPLTVLTYWHLLILLTLIDFIFLMPSCLMPHASCLMPLASCLMPHAKCQMPNAKCQMNALCFMSDVSSFMLMPHGPTQISTRLSALSYNS